MPISSLHPSPADRTPRYDLPDMLPEHGLPADAVLARFFGLKDRASNIFNSASLQEELEQLHSWSTAIINVGRPFDVNPVESAGTWRRNVQHVSQVLGFMWLHAPSARPIGLALLRDHFNPEVLR